MAMKLLSLAACAAGAVASSSAAADAGASAPLSSSSSSSTGRILSSPASSSATRTLQDEGSGYTYSYLDDLTGYSLKYSSCLRVKIPQENDDDAVDGNVNFYNGRYHAQYAVYATFRVCGDGCDECETGAEYASEAGEFLETALEHWEGYCGNCAAACYRRRLEEEGDDDAAQLDCDACSAQCASYDGGSDDAADESAYVDCQEGFQDDDGLQLYYGPQCSDDGRLVVGVFYDDECTIKTKHDSPSFDYRKFGTAADGCVDCSDADNGGADACEDMYGEAYHCLNGKDQTGRDDGTGVCSAVKKAFTVIDYGGVKKRRSGADAFLKVFFGLLLLSAVGGFFFMTFTYYIRHRGERGQPMLSSDDVHEDEDGALGGPGQLSSPPAGATLT
mmetsp:Transcript_19722/g.42291  ORF Transcript_19722/g.42291 Transcript_19722/m.42291 type:complete len:389 (+) Transcript_19722:137-1303(+)